MMNSPSTESQLSKLLLVNKCLHNFDVDITRRGPLGNPFPITKSKDRITVVHEYSELLKDPLYQLQIKPSTDLILGMLKAGSDVTLGCVCNGICHGQPLMAYINGLRTESKPF